MSTTKGKPTGEENPFADLGGELETENPFADLGGELEVVEEVEKKSPDETGAPAPEVTAGSGKLSVEKPKPTGKEFAPVKTASEVEAEALSRVSKKGEAKTPAPRGAQVSDVPLDKKTKDIVIKSIYNLPDNLINSDAARSSYVSTFSKKRNIAVKPLLKLYDEVRVAKNSIKSLEEKYQKGAAAVAPPPTAQGITLPEATVVGYKDPEAAVQELYQLGNLYNFVGDYEKAISIFSDLESEVRKQAEQKLSDKNFRARAPKNFTEQMQAPVTQALAYTHYLAGNKTESDRIYNILKNKNLIDYKTELAPVGSGDYLQPSYTAPEYGFQPTKGAEYTPEEGVRPASRPTPESEYLNAIARTVESVSNVVPMYQMAAHGMEKLAEGVSDIGVYKGESPYPIVEQAQNNLKIAAGIMESMAGVAGMTTPAGGAFAVPFFAAQTYSPPEVAEWMMPVSKLVRDYYAEKGEELPEWAENASILGDFALLGALHKGATKTQKKIADYKTTKNRAALMDEFFSEMPKDVVESSIKTIERRWEESGKNAEAYDVDQRNRMDDIKEQMQEVEVKAEQPSTVQEYNPPVVPETLRSIPEGADVEMNGKIGKIERGDDGTWYFVDEEGNSSQIPVEDKFNPQEKLSTLGLQPLPEISEKEIARAMADGEQIGFVDYKGKKYFVSIDRSGNPNPVGDVVYEVLPDGRMVNRFDSHPDPRFAADRKLAITNAMLDSKGLPKRTRNIEPWKEAERYELDNGSIAYEPETVNASGGKGQYLFYDNAGNARVITEAEYLRLRELGKPVKEGGVVVKPEEQPQAGSVEGGENPALKDVESTAKALEGVEADKLSQIGNPVGISSPVQNKYFGLSIKEENQFYNSNKEYQELYNKDEAGNITDVESQRMRELYVNEQKRLASQKISEAYHKAKADGSNPELVKAVEDLLKPEAEMPKVEEVKLEAPVVEEAKVEEVKVEEPVAEEVPAFEPPKIEVEIPAAAEEAPAAPVEEAPVVDEKLQQKNETLGMVDKYNSLPKKSRATVGANLFKKIQDAAKGLGLGVSYNKSGRVVLLDSKGRAVRKTPVRLTEEQKAQKLEEQKNFEKAMDQPVDVYQAVLQFFVQGGKISEAAFNEILGSQIKQGKDVLRGISSKEGRGIDELYMYIEDFAPDVLRGVDEVGDFGAVVADVLMSHTTKESMRQELARYGEKQGANWREMGFDSLEEYERYTGMMEENQRERLRLGLPEDADLTYSQMRAIEMAEQMYEGEIEKLLEDLQENEPKTPEEIQKFYEENGLDEKIADSKVDDLQPGAAEPKAELPTEGAEAEFAKIREEDAIRAEQEAVERREAEFKEIEKEYKAAASALEKERVRVDEILKESQQEKMFEEAPKEDVLFEEKAVQAGRDAALAEAENRFRLAERKYTEALEAVEAEKLAKTPGLKTALSALRAAQEKYRQNYEKPGFAFDPKKQAKDLYDLHQRYLDVAKEAIKEGAKTLEDFAKYVGGLTKGAAMAFNEAIKKIAPMKAADFENKRIVKSYNEPVVLKTRKTTKTIIGEATKMLKTPEYENLKAQIRAEVKAALDGFAAGKKMVKEKWSAEKAQNKEFAERINNLMQNLKGKISDKQARAIVKKALKATTPYRMRQFESYAGRMILNANYDAILSQAKDVRSKVKALARPQKAAQKLGANNIAILKEFAKISPEDVTDYNEYIDIGQRLIDSNKNMKVDKTGGVKYDKPAVSNQEVADFIRRQDEFMNNQMKQELAQQYQYLVDAGVLDPKAMSLKDMVSMIDAIETYEGPMTVEQFEQIINENIERIAEQGVTEPEKAMAAGIQSIMANRIATIKEQALKAFRGAVKYGQMDLETYLVDNAPELTSRQKEAINSILSIDVEKLDQSQAMLVNRAIQNITVNNSFAGVSQVVEPIAFNQKALVEAKKAVAASKLDLGQMGRINRIARSKDLAFERIYRSRDLAIKMKQALGVERLWNGVASMTSRYNDFFMNRKNPDSYISTRERLSKQDKVDYNSNRNRAIRGMFAKAVKNFGGTEMEIAAEFQRHKRQILENVLSYLSAGGKVEYTAEGYIKTDSNGRPVFTEVEGELSNRVKKIRAEGELLFEIYNELFANANNVSELTRNVFNDASGNITLVKKAIDINKEIRNDVFESAEMDQNKIDLDYQENYTRDKYKSTTSAPIDEMAQMQNLFDVLYTPKNLREKASGSMNKIVRQDKAYKGRVLNFDFDSVFQNALYEDMFASSTSKNINQLKELFRSKEFDGVMGGEENARYMREMLTRAIGIMRGDKYRESNIDMTLKAVTTKIARNSVRIGLYGTSQILKQTAGIFTGTIMSQGIGSVDRMMYYMGLGFKYSNHPSLKDFNISRRGDVLAGFWDEGTGIRPTEKGLSDRTIIEKIDDWGTRLNKALGSPLGAGDVLIARASWWAYYLDAMHRKGILPDDIDFQNFVPDADAAAYAEQMTSRMQNANDPASMPELYQSKSTTVKIIRDVLFPFSSFGLNQNRRMATDIDMILNGSQEQKVEAVRSFNAAITEQLVFNWTKVFLLGSATSWGADWLMDYYGLREEDKEKYKKAAKGPVEEKDLSDKVFWNSVEDVIFAGMPTPLRTLGKQGINEISSAITSSNDGKQKGPFYIHTNDMDPNYPQVLNYMGMYGIVGGMAYDIYKYAPIALTGTTEKYVTDKETGDVVPMRTDVTPGEQKAAATAVLIDALAFAGLSDQDITILNRKMKGQFGKYMMSKYGGEKRIEIMQKGTTTLGFMQAMGVDERVEAFANAWNTFTPEERMKFIKDGIEAKRIWTPRFVQELNRKDPKLYKEFEKIYSKAFE